MPKEMLYKIKEEKHNAKDLKKILSDYPEIKFVSLMGIDLYGNGTEERIPTKILYPANGIAIMPTTMSILTKK